MSEKKRVKIGKINIHMTNKWFYSFIAIFIFILAGGAIFAVNAGTDPAGGHAIDELSPPSGCSGYLKYNSGNWECSSFESYWNENSGGISYGSDVGAASFCDENMNNCFSPGDVGSGTTIGDKSCSDDEILKYDSGSSEWVCGTADIGDEIQFSDYEEDNSYCYGTAYSCSQLTCTDVTSSSCSQCTNQYGCSWSKVDTISPTSQEDVGAQDDDIYECKE
ncbi:MAG TPA: hypothetical protein VJ912_01680, partial [Candidatus Nanoarchaeia archaeon]|nr:hypothetical protein [Candidatus Nanoarchaeia archaeon]